MDEDLTASHWDDVLTPSQLNTAPSNINSFFDSLHIDDPHKDPEAHEASANESAPEPAAQQSDELANDVGEDSGQGGPSSGFASHFSSDPYNQAERDQLDEIRKQQLSEHKSSLLSALTSGDDGFDMASSLVSPTKNPSTSELFEDRGSPLKLASLTTSAPSDAITSPIRAGQLKNGKFKASRGRKYPAKTISKHLGGNSSDLVDPLSFANEKESAADSAHAVPQDKTKQLVAEAESPLYGIANPTPEEPSAQIGPEQSAKPVKEEATNGNNLEISVADPLKVGDITTAHIVYGIKTRNKNPDSTSFPQVNGPVQVSRRYRDFRWIYHQLENNHPGKIIPPPPSKQTYIGRFNENFIENRRLSLEKMLMKISKIPQLANDPDFVMFLTSENFAQESKDREQASGSGASLHASNNEDDEDKSTATTFVSGASSGFMSSLFTISAKHQEPDEYFSKKKGYIDDLEHNLRTFYKSLELIASQRIDIAAVVEEISAAVTELADLEISKTTTDLLNAFVDVHLKLKENLDRVNLQDQLTLGFTIEEYLRIIGSVKHTFEARNKVYQQYTSFSQELAKKEESLQRLTSKYKSSVDKINSLQFEVDKLKQRVEYFENSFKTISETIKEEMQNFETEKIEDFRNSVEIFIESSIESQKEAIELWETFYERQKLASV